MIISARPPSRLAVENSLEPESIESLFTEEKQCGQEQEAEKTEAGASMVTACGLMDVGLAYITPAAEVPVCQAF